jgi:hypothetical protein
MVRSTLAKVGLNSTEAVMNQIVNSVTSFVTNGITNILGFIASLINWSIHELQAFFNLPWANMSVWKLLFAALVLALAGWLLYRGGKGLLEATIKLFEAFGTWFKTLIGTLPTIIGVGLVLAAGIWVIQTFKF